MEHGWQSRSWRILATLLLVLLAICANLELTRRVEPSAAPLLFAAVLFASWLGGWECGLIATAIAVAADDYFFITPRYAWTLNWTVLVRLAVFLAVALVTSYLTSQRERLLLSERRARLDAESANRVKDHFLAATSHELRTPLCAIAMWLDMLRQDDSAELLSEGMEIIRDNIDVVCRIIEDLLDSARINTGKLRVEMRPLDVGGPVGAAVEAIRPQAKENGVELEVALAPPVAPVDADFARMRQVVSNLLANAVKFTPKGGKIAVRLAYHDSQAQIQVEDSGRGIAPDDLGHVFESFWQANARGARRADGLGLGLSIAHELVRLHRGTITAQSRGEGAGATFTIELPLLLSKRSGAGGEISDEPVLSKT